jgi:hydroxyacylglutathione hydrolase
MEIAKDLYAYPWQDPYENNCNTYVIAGRKALLIDPGHSRYFPGLVSQLQVDGLSADSVGLVLMTHSHPDHFEGIEAFPDRTVQIAMSREEERYLLGNGKDLFEMMRQPLPQFRIDIYLKQGELHFLEKTFEIHPTPGHSPGSLSVYWPGRKALFTGDVLFSGGIGRTDFPEGDPEQLANSIEKLSRLEIEILLPGHGEIVVGKDAVTENFRVIRQSFFSYL